MKHVYYCECLNDTRRGRRGIKITKAQQLRSSETYLNTTIKGRKIA